MMTEIQTIEGSQKRYSPMESQHTKKNKKQNCSKKQTKISHKSVKALTLGLLEMRYTVDYVRAT